jgi:hypothetical protein
MRLLLLQVLPLQGSDPLQLSRDSTLQLLR